MLSLPGVDRKHYQAWFQGPFPRPRCPCCRHSRLRPHGSYWRYVDGRRWRIRRGRCSDPDCGVTHAIVPEDLCAYRDLTLDALASVLSARGPSAGAREGVGEGDRASVRRARRWRLEASGERARQSAHVVASVGVGPWWQRVLEVFGSLVVWRRWLWSETRYFATGLLGLFRRGRPPWLVAEVST